KGPPLVLAGPGLDPLAGVQERQADRPVRFPESEDASVVVYRRWTKSGVGPLGNLEGGTGAGDGSDREISREPERIPDLPVADSLDRDLVRRPFSPDDIGDVVARGSERRERK